VLVRDGRGRRKFEAKRNLSSTYTVSARKEPARTEGGGEKNGWKGRIKRGTNVRDTKRKMRDSLFESAKYVEGKSGQAGRRNNGGGGQ